MKRVRVYSCLHVAEAEVVCQALQLQGLHADVQNTRLRSLVGEVPVDQALVGVWVNEDEVDAAEEVLAELRKQQEDETPKDCPDCGHPVTGEMAVCWNCSGLQEGIDGQDEEFVVGPSSLDNVPRWKSAAGGWVVKGLLFGLAAAVVLWILVHYVSPKEF